MAAFGAARTVPLTPGGCPIERDRDGAAPAQGDHRRLPAFRRERARHRRNRGDGGEGERGAAHSVLVYQDAVGGAFGIVELAVAQRPEERHEAEETEAQRNRDQEQQAVHRTARAKRSEFATTTSELADMAAAAISGVSRPAMASGTARTL